MAREYRAFIIIGVNKMALDRINSPMILNLSPHKDNQDFKTLGISDLRHNDFQSFVSSLVFKKLPSNRELISRAHKITNIALKYFDDIEPFKPVIVDSIPNYLNPFVVKYLQEEGFSVFYPYYEYTEKEVTEKNLIARDINGKLFPDYKVKKKVKKCVGFISNL